MRTYLPEAGRASLSLFIVFMIIAVFGVLVSVGIPGNGQNNSATISAAVVSPSPIPSTFKTKFVSLDYDRSLSQAAAQNSVRSFLPGQSIRAEYPIDVYKLRIEISVEDGSFSPVTAEVFVPKTDDPSKQFPLLVYAPGTTGLDDRCAPSRENQTRPTFGNYVNQMVSQSSQGFVVMMPNYEGFDNPDRLHYYFNADLEARTLLGTARELLQSNAGKQLPIQPNTLFFGGYSQGGHASFAAADFVDLYTPELKISGIIGHGPTTNLFELLKDNPNLAPYLIYAYQAYYEDFKPEDILTPRELTRLARARELCVDQAFQFNTTNQKMMYNESFLNALLADQVAASYPAIAARLEQNSSGTHFEEIPTLIVQGDKDPIVTIDFQKQFAQQICDNGVPVTFAEYKNLDHFQSRMKSFSDTNLWMRKIVEGEQLNKMCN